MAFSVKALHQLRRDGLIHRQNLDGHATAERLMFTEEYHRRATPAQPIEDAITPEHQARGMAPDYAVALVVGEQSPGGEGIRRPVARRQGGQQVCGLDEEVLHRTYAEKLQVEQFLEQSASGCWKASEQEHGVKASRARERRG
jgi:hypothetical protein